MEKGVYIINIFCKLFEYNYEKVNLIMCKHKIFHFCLNDILKQEGEKIKNEVRNFSFLNQILLVVSSPNASVSLKFTSMISLRLLIVGQKNLKVKLFF